jgi:hypothetical protein
MLRGTEEVRRLGRRALAGERIADATLAALYALPSGTVVGRAALRFDPSERIERVSAAAARAGLAGPFARVGDRAAMLVWRGAGESEPGLVAAPWPDLLAEPERLVLLPNAAALRLMDSASNREAGAAGRAASPREALPRVRRAKSNR